MQDNHEKIYKELKTLVSAKYPIIYVVSHEEDRVIETINKIASSLYKTVCPTFGFAPIFFKI